MGHHPMIILYVLAKDPKLEVELMNSFLFNEFFRVNRFRSEQKMKYLYICVL